MPIQAVIFDMYETLVTQFCSPLYYGTQIAEDLGLRPSEVKCPQCGEWVDVFVLMGGRPGQTGTLATDEKCACGYVLKAGSFESDYER